MRSSSCAAGTRASLRGIGSSLRTLRSREVEPALLLGFIVSAMPDPGSDIRVREKPRVVSFPFQFSRAGFGGIV